MENQTSYCYNALNEDSYYKLAAYASTIPATVTLHPGPLTIVVSENAKEYVGKFIDDNGLDFHINPIELHDDNIEKLINSDTTDADTLRKIIFRMMREKETMIEAHQSVVDSITKQCDSAKEDREMYQKWYHESSEKNDKVKSQIQAIAVLIDSIFPLK